MLIKSRKLKVTQFVTKFNVLCFSQNYVRNPHKPDLLLRFCYSPVVVLLGQFSCTISVPICNTHAAILFPKLKYPNI